MQMKWSMTSIWVIYVHREREKVDFKSREVNCLKECALALIVELFDPKVMHVVNTIFIISVSNSWMVTYHQKWNSHGKILNSCCPFTVTRCVYFMTVCAPNLWWLHQCEYNNIVAAFRGMHVSLAKHSYAWLPRKCDYRTEARTDRRQTKLSLWSALLRRWYKKHSTTLCAFVYRDSSHLWRSFSHNSTKITFNS